MSISTLARRIPLQSLAITPLLAAALLVGTGGAPTSSVSPHAATGSAQGPVTIKARSVAYVSAYARAVRGRAALSNTRSLSTMRAEKLFPVARLRMGIA